MRDCVHGLVHAALAQATKTLSTISETEKNMIFLKILKITLHVVLVLLYKPLQNDSSCVP